MKTLNFSLTAFLIAVGSAGIFSACSPNYPASTPPEGLCANKNCNLKPGEPSLPFYSQFITKMNGDCSNPATVTWTSMQAFAVLQKSGDGLAEIHLYLQPDGTYKGNYAESAGSFGTLNPLKPAKRRRVKVDGTFYLENDKIVIRGVGVGRKSGDAEMLVQPLTSSDLAKPDFGFSTSTVITFKAVQTPRSPDGQTVGAYCAAHPSTQPATQPATQPPTQPAAPPVTGQPTPGQPAQVTPAPSPSSQPAPVAPAPQPTPPTTPQSPVSQPGISPTAPSTT